MALTIPSATLSFRATVPERRTGAPPDSTGVIVGNNVLEYFLQLSNGTGANQLQVMHFRSYSSSTAVVIDLADGDSPTDPSATVAIPEVVAIIIKNRSTTSGEYLTFGAGTEPIASCWASSGDGAPIPPSGIYVLTSPIDGFSTTDNVADKITITPATGTIEFDVMVLGRAAS